MNLPVVMTIAGSDNSAGAGAQADLKTMCALGVYGVTAITCVVAEVPGKVSAIQPIEPGIVAERRTGRGRIHACQSPDKRRAFTRQ